VAAFQTLGIETLLPTPSSRVWRQAHCVYLIFSLTVSQAGAGSALLFVSLVGGFGAPRINKVLASTGYLTSVSRASYLRIIETVQMVSGATPPSPKRAASLRALLVDLEVETPLPSNSPHDHMILRVDLVGSLKGGGNTLAFKQPT
jgi:hypothetical protein